jgi:hypothetical protein
MYCTNESVEVIVNRKPQPGSQSPSSLSVQHMSGVMVTDLVLSEMPRPSRGVALGIEDLLMLINNAQHIIHLRDA